MMGVPIGGGIVYFCGTRWDEGITYTQVAQYCVMVFAYTIPVIFISLIITGNAIPQWTDRKLYQRRCRRWSTSDSKNQSDFNRFRFQGVHLE